MEPLTTAEILSPLTEALEANHVTAQECIKVIARKMRYAKRPVVVDKQLKLLTDLGARAEAAEVLLAFLGFPKTTRTEHTGRIDHNIIHKPYESMTPDEIRAKIAALDREIEALERGSKAKKGTANRRANSGKVGSRKK